MPDVILPPELRSGVPAMDELHALFLSSLNALSDVPDSEFESRYADFLRQTEQAFAIEEDWMEERDLPFLQSHREQHARVLGALHHVYARIMDGDLCIGRDVIKRLLPRWFELHASTMDAVLALSMLSMKAPTPTAYAAEAS